MRSLSNSIISTAKSGWYGVTDRMKVRRARQNRDAVSGPLVSILLPTYNRAEMLFERALPSILDQTYKNFEVIIAVHGSTDETVRHLTGCSDFRVVPIFLEREQTYPPTAENHWLAGPVAPLNAARLKAKGEWLARIDDDDEWLHNHLEESLIFAILGGYEFVSSSYIRITDTGEEEIKGEGRPMIGGTQTWLWRADLNMGWNPDCWRKKWHRVNDTDFAERIRRAGVRVGYRDKPGCIIRPRPGEVEVGSKAYLRDKEATEKRFAF